MSAGCLLFRHIDSVCVSGWDKNSQGGNWPRCTNLKTRMPNGKSDADKAAKRAAKRARRKAKRAAKRAAQQKAGGGGSGNGANMQQVQAAVRRELNKEIPKLREASGGTGGKSKHFQNLLRATIDPANADPQRWPIASSRPTAVNKLRTTLQASGYSNTAEKPFAANLQFAAIFRDPRLAAVVYQDGTGQSTYQLQFESASAPSPTFFYTLANADQPVTPIKLVNTAGYARHGAVYWPSIDGEDTVRFWSEVENVTSTTQYTFTGASASTSCSVFMTVERCGLVYETNLTATSDAGGVVIFTHPAGRPGRVALTIRSGFPSGANVGVTLTTSCPYSFRQLSLPDFDKELPIIDAIRVTSVSAMYSDRSAALYTQGNIVTVQADAGEDWCVHAGLTSASISAGGTGIDNYGTIVGYNNSKKGAYKDGRYNFLKPAGEEDFAWFEMGNGTGINKYPPPINDGVGPHDYLVILADPGNITSMSGEWTFVHHVEVETESQWRQIDIPKCPPVVFLDVLYVVAAASQDYCNSNHLEKIWKWVQDHSDELLSLGETAAAFLPPQAKIPAAAVFGGLRYLTRKQAR